MQSIAISRLTFSFGLLVLTSLASVAGLVIGYTAGPPPFALQVGGPTRQDTRQDSDSRVLRFGSMAEIATSASTYGYRFIAWSPMLQMRPIEGDPFGPDLARVGGQVGQGERSGGGGAGIPHAEALSRREDTTWADVRRTWTRLFPPRLRGSA